jgi:hypothetical protein
MGCERLASLNEVNSRAILEAPENAKRTFNHGWSEHIFNWIDHTEQGVSVRLVPAIGAILLHPMRPQIAGRPSCLSSVSNRVVVGPVSRPMRTTSGAFELT